jgi:Receptor family ligand binding region
MIRAFFARIIALAFMVLAGAQKRVIRIGGVAPETNKLGQMNPVAQTLLAAYVLAMKDLKPVMKSKYNVTLQYSFHDSRQRFGWAVMSYIDMLTTSFGNYTLHGLVGAAINPITQALAFVSTDYNIAQVAYGANAAMFSSKTNYPTLFRIFPSDGFEAYALAEMVVKTFGWSRVVMVYSADTYGVTASQVFQYRLSQLGGTIVGQVKIVPGQAVTNVTTASLHAQLEKVAAVDGRIWVLLSDDIVAVQRFFIMAQGSRLLTQNTYMLGGSAISTSALWQNTGLGYQYLDTIMDGYIGLQPAQYDWMMTAAGKDFIARLRSQNASAWTNSGTGKRTCSSAIDDAHHNIFQIKLNNGTGACLGMDYSLIGLDGTLVTPLAAYMYDAVHLMAQGIVDYCINHYVGADGNWFVPDSIPGDLLSKWLIANTEISGVTGPIKLSSGVIAVRTTVLLRAC